ncbi:MAG: PAS domain-containing protein [Candidatus Cloacimonadales bacterium]|nr:PAS domain-containing protein [Candidatus Cloacimonadales bacterium]
MSEFINNREKRQESLLKFSQGILQGKDGTKLLGKYGEALKYITPHDMIAMEERQLKMGITPQQIKDKIEKLMNVVYEQLKKYEWEKPQEGHPLFYLMLENRELEKRLATIKTDLKEKRFSKFKRHIADLSGMENHYLRKENVLFSYLERVWEHCRPLAVMWSIHDDIRMKLKHLNKILLEKEDFDAEIYNQVGELFFLMYGMIFKEELVVYPVAMETLDSYHWQKIKAQSAEIGYSFIEPPIKQEKIEKQSRIDLTVQDTIFQTETGSLSNLQIEQIFNTLPLDITFIDANDEVRYFSNSQDRFFPRSPAIIGRKVQNCHPPESVHIVEKILTSFKTGEKDEAAFHIRLKGKFVLIKYHAIRKKDKYLGSLEVSQDITDIKKLKSEKRLLDWE